MAINTDTYIESLSLSLEDLYEMTDAEREAYYENLLEELSDEDAEALRQAIADDMSAIGEELSVLQDELDKIIDSSSSTTEEIARAEYYLTDIEELLSLTNEFSSEWGAAETSLAAHSVDKTDGTDYVFDAASDTANGEEFVIDCTGASETEDEPLFDDPHAEDDGVWVDTDGDGYTDTLASDEDDGTADYDTNGDGKVTETDMLDSGETLESQSVTITLDEGDTIALADYDSETGTTRWSVTTDDGVTYYVTIKGTPDIRLSGSYTFDSADIEDIWAPELLHRVFENTTTSVSFGEALDVEDPDGETQTYYTIYDMANEDDDTISIDPSVTDFDENRTYEIHCQDDVQDTINLEFDDDVTLAFSEGPDGEIVITATNLAGETVTIKIFDWQALAHVSSDAEKMDVINISGGVIDDEDIQDAYDISDTTPDEAEDFYALWTAAYIIFHNDSEDSLYLTGYENDLF